MCIKGLVLSFVFDIDRNISTAHCRSSSGNSVDLLSRTICTTWLLVTGLSQTSLVVGGCRSKALSALWEEETDPSAVRCGRGRLSYCLIVGIHAIGIYGFHELKLRPFLNTPIRPGIIRSGTKLSLLTETLTGTLIELRRLST